MQYNLLENSYIYPNTTSGNVSLSIEEIENIISINGSVTISGANDDILCIDSNLGDRIAIDQVRYYFNSSTASGVVASGIAFYYRDDDPTVSGIVPSPYSAYLELTTSIGDGYYYTTVPAPSAPRYIRLLHTVSGTSITGDVVGLSVLNDDTVVDFGSDGTLESTAVLTSLSYLDYNDYIREIEIYNDGSEIANAHVMFKPQYNDADELMSISASENGPWVFARNTDYIISNGDNWDAGQYDNTSISGIPDGKLRLNPGYNVGTYTTPIFQNDSVKFAYIDMLSTSVSGAIIAVDDNDYTSTIQIRSSSSKPIDYNVYRTLYYNGNTYNNQFWYKEYLVTTDTEVYDSYDATGVRFGDETRGGYGYTLDVTQFTIDENTQKTAFFTAHEHVYYSYFTQKIRYYIEVYILSQHGVQEKHVILGTDIYTNTVPHSHNTILSDMKFDNEGGLWVYLYTKLDFNESGTIVSSGYHLYHLDSDLSVTYYSGAHSSDFVTGSWAPVVGGDSLSLWYCNKEGIQAVIKLGSTGIIEVSYDNVTNLKGLCATDDGGCWFINADNLYKLNSSGVLVDSITNLEVNSELAFVEFDSEDKDFLWIVDGTYIRRIRLDGSIFSSIYFEGFTIRRLLPTSEGLWVYCIEGATGDFFAKHIGKLSAGVTKTIECVGTYWTGGAEIGDPSDILPKSISYDNPVLGNLIPLSDDLTWNDSLPWNKAITDNAVLPHEEYNQLKLTLRRPSIDIDAPTVENIYYQDSVEITDIYPGQSKTLYLKISIPDGVNIGGDYSSMLRAWWEQQIN